jgi:DNA processing protein
MANLPALEEIAPETPLFALANERKHWSPDEIASFRRDLGTLRAALWGSKGVQATLADQTIAAAAGLVAYQLLFGRKVKKMTKADQEIIAAMETLMGMIISGIVAIPLTSPEYPRRLGSIPNPPLLLYTTGSTRNFDRCVAVTGTREPSRWGQGMAGRLGKRLAQEKLLVTSGLARGVDTCAHRGALSADNGRTVAVTATPLDTVYPPENAGLARRIVERGALVSEHGLERGAGKVEFLRRNRIISGLSAVQIVVETSGTGGTRQQAATALSQGREVIILKPPVGETRAVAGHDVLVEMGAVSCTSVNDALDRTREIRRAMVA